MRKLKIDKKYFKPCVYVFFLALAIIIAEKLIGNISPVFTGIKNIFNFIIKILTPFLYGFGLAYLFNPAVRFAEGLFDRIRGFNSRKTKRAAAILVNFVVVVVALIFIINYITPELMSSFRNVSDSVQEYVKAFNSGGQLTITNESIIQFFDDIKLGLDESLATINATFSTDFSSGQIVEMITGTITKLFNSLPSVISSIFSSTLSIAGALFNFSMGLFIAFYMLMEKDSYSEMAKRFVAAFFKKNTADGVVASVRRINKIFERFIVGKSIDSAIIGTLFFLIALFILKLPNALFLAVIIGITNMIPFFGPFIGAIPVILIVLLNSLGSMSAEVPFNFYPALFTTLTIFILQQLDGNVIGPKILGESTGLNSLEVILAITVGGALFGVIGMFIGVPLFAVIKVIIISFINKKHTEKNGPTP